MTKPIGSRAHAALDYSAGALLIAAPWLLALNDVGGAAVAVPVLIGMLVILQSLVTDYELGVAEVLPLRTHLMTDVVAGLVLAASPWLFGFAGEGTNAWLPQLLAGAGLMAAGLMTRAVRDDVRLGTHAPRTVRHGHGKRTSGLLIRSR